MSESKEKIEKEREAKRQMLVNRRLVRFATRGVIALLSENHPDVARQATRVLLTEDPERAEINFLVRLLNVTRRVKK